MKRFITTMLLLSIMSSVLGIYVIPRTITVDTPTLTALRSSLLPSSPYYDPYIAELSDSDDMVIPEGNEQLPTRAAPFYIDRMNWAVKAHLESALFYDSSDESKIQYIMDILVNDIPPASTALDYFTDTSFKALDRALHLIYYTQNAAMLYDCLYYAPTSAVPDTIKTKLRDILYGSIHLTMDTINSYGELDRVDQSPLN